MSTLHAAPSPTNGSRDTHLPLQCTSPTAAPSPPAHPPFPGGCKAARRATRGGGETARGPTRGQDSGCVTSDGGHCARLAAGPPTVQRGRQCQVGGPSPAVAQGMKYPPTLAVDAFRRIRSREGRRGGGGIGAAHLLGWRFTMTAGLQAQRGRGGHGALAGCGHVPRGDDQRLHRGLS